MLLLGIEKMLLLLETSLFSLQMEVCVIDRR
jgi:hypothetical protein